MSICLLRVYLSLRQRLRSTCELHYPESSENRPLASYVALASEVSPMPCVSNLDMKHTTATYRTSPGLQVRFLFETQPDVNIDTFTDANVLLCSARSCREASFWFDRIGQNTSSFYGGQSTVSLSISINLYTAHASAAASMKAIQSNKLRFPSAYLRY